MFKKGKRNQNDFLLIALILFIIGCLIFSYLKMTHERLKNESKEELRKYVLQAEQVLSKEIQERFSTLYTVRELLGSQYEVGTELAKKLDGAKEGAGFDHLGMIDKNLIYYDSTGGKIGAPEEYLKEVFDGKNAVHRYSDYYSGDGIVFCVPYYKESEITGALCAKFDMGNFLNKLSLEEGNASLLVVNTEGKIVLPSGDFKSYVRNTSWDDIFEEALQWEGKDEFLNRMFTEKSAVASATAKNDGEMYFAAAPVSTYPELYVISITSASVVKTKVFTSMFIISLLLVLLLLLMLLILGYSFFLYIRNKKEMYAVANVDSLTGLPSKAKHKEDAQLYIDRQEKNYAYITFDIDNFKFVNEMFGYEYGNHVLFQVASIVKENTKEDELCSRVSGDNFAMLWRNPDTTEQLTERIQKMFADITDFNGKDSELSLCTLKFSCGVFKINGAIDINTVRANANMARLESKKRVFKDVVYYNETLKTKRVEERELEYEASAALARGEFVVYYQPKFDVSSEKIIGAEALVRWNHPTRGLLAPSLFIPLFEANGFIIELDMYVLDKSCEVIENWRRQGIAPLCISVNLSRAHLYDQNLMDQILSIVTAHNVPAKYIEFELTETAIYDEMDTLLRTMNAIKKEGFRLSMDDFGSGYSSLNLLRRLPVDVLKLDRGFLEDCDSSPDSVRDKRIVVHVISMAKDLEMTVLAEGVETKNQKDFLETAKCDMIQGFYYAKPMPEEEFEMLYKKQEGLSGEKA